MKICFDHLQSFAIEGHSMEYLEYIIHFPKTESRQNHS